MTNQSDEPGSVTVLPVARVRRQAKKWGTRLFVGVSVALVAGLMLVTQILPDGTTWLSAHESLILALLIPTIIAVTSYFFWGLSSATDSVSINGTTLRLAGTQVDLSQATVRFASWERPGAGKVGVVLTVEDAVHVLRIGGAGANLAAYPESGTPRDEVDAFCVDGAAFNRFAERVVGPGLCPDPVMAGAVTDQPEPVQLTMTPAAGPGRLGRLFLNGFITMVAMGIAGNLVHAFVPRVYELRVIGAGFTLCIALLCWRASRKLHSRTKLILHGSDIDLDPRPRALQRIDQASLSTAPGSFFTSGGSHAGEVYAGPVITLGWPNGSSLRLGCLTDRLSWADPGKIHLLVDFYISAADFRNLVTRLGRADELVGE